MDLKAIPQVVKPNGTAGCKSYETSQICIRKLPETSGAYEWNPKYRPDIDSTMRLSSVFRDFTADGLIIPRKNDRDEVKAINDFRR